MYIYIYIYISRFQGVGLAGNKGIHYTGIII